MSAPRERVRNHRRGTYSGKSLIDTFWKDEIASPKVERLLKATQSYSKLLKATRRDSES